MNPPHLLRAAPASTGYVAGLIVTSAALGRLAQPDADRLLSAMSTDMTHLGSVPWFVLPASALVITGTPVWAWALGLLAVLVPLERRLGSRRTAMVFVSGHVLATLATELPIGWLVAQGGLSDGALTRLDVGISYGFYTALAAATGPLPVRLRWSVLGGTAALLVGQLVANPDMTGCGHLIALACGVGWWAAVGNDVPARLRPVLVTAGARRLCGATVEA